MYKKNVCSHYFKSKINANVRVDYTGLYIVAICILLCIPFLNVVLGLSCTSNEAQYFA
jgi:hypothetical protein